ncbi:FapA family protein [Shewanella psychrotolerans]|uniref:FapA family protein n=1 Tax=Shewanella psychrotolerans TaxID=2864206 RepID=UPI001C654F25|nr:FapA family protein [Shewanella psychrotolerans]QYK00084.1 FapA family protein [Shewanella psychrotolerans]
MRKGMYHKQGGFAGIIMLAIFGLALVAMVTSSMRYIKSSQETGTTVHAITQAQIRAWSAVEAVRQFLYQIGRDGALTLEANNSISFEANTGLSGKIISVNNASSRCVDGVQVISHITGTIAESSSTIETIYCVQESIDDGLNTVTLGNAVFIEGSLDLSGDINIINGDNTNTSFFINGDIDGRGSLSGFSLLYSSGNITLSGSQNDITTVSSEQNVVLTGSGSYSYVTAMGDITLSGSVSTLNAKANGNIDLKSSTTVSERLTAIGDVNVRAGSKAGSIYTQGDIEIKSATVGYLEAEGNFTESGNSKVNEGKVAGELDYNGGQVNVSKIPGFTVSITPLTKMTVNKLEADVWTLRSKANLAFDHDDTGKVIVDVKNMSEIDDGRYYLVGSGGFNDYLCTSSTYSDSSCNKKICQGHSNYNSCFTYNSSSKTWVIAGKEMVPAILWFNGSVDLKQGTFVNTILATENIDTSAQLVIKAPNYSGYSDVCINPTYSDFYPTNLCSIGNYVSNPLANTALMAGGYVDDIFSGGDISLGASTKVFGSVVCANLISTTGSSVIHGYLTVGNQKASSEGSSFRGSTTIDLSNLPSTYEPEHIVTRGSETNENGNGSTITNVTQLWSRYL